MICSFRSARHTLPYIPPATTLRNTAAQNSRSAPGGAPSARHAESSERTRKTRSKNFASSTGPAPGRVSDLYHGFLRAPWSVALAAVVAGFVLINLAFALGYLALGGVAGVRPGSLFDHYAFSVETMCTIGYGDMHPVSTAARALVIVEAIVGLLVTALVTGVSFAKF